MSISASYCLREFFEYEVEQAVLFIQGKSHVPQSMLTFLEKNAWTPGSGYIKEYIWKYITRNSLNEKQIRILHQIALNYLEQRVGREFRDMCRAMHRIGNDAFWTAVGEKRNSQNPKVRARAIVLLKYKDSILSLWQHQQAINAIRRIWNEGKLP